MPPDDIVPDRFVEKDPFPEVQNRKRYASSLEEDPFSFLLGQALEKDSQVSYAERQSIVQITHSM